MKTIVTISKEELKKKIDRKENVQIINVLAPEYYKDGFIPGSMRIPTAELENRLWEIDKDREVIVYCASYKCDASKRAAEALATLGFDVKAYEGGIKEWKEAGYPVE